MKEGKVVVITGLADGMGREVAKLLSSMGYIIAGFDVMEEGIKTLEKELKEDSRKHYLKVLDITNRKGVLQFRDEVIKRYGHVDTVISNVGMAFFSPFEEVDLEKALKCFEINVIGAAAIFQAFIPSMRERREGKLIAMASLVGRIPFPFESIYSSTKFAIEGLVQSFKYEVEPFGLKVAIVEPAQVSTTFAAKSQIMPKENSPYLDRVKRMLARDQELIKSAPDPIYAAKKIVKVVEAKNPRLHNQIEIMSSIFAFLNQHAPRWFKDALLLSHMNLGNK